jgi:hypothetical protein
MLYKPAGPWASPVFLLVELRGTAKDAKSAKEMRGEVNHETDEKKRKKIEKQEGAW